MSIAQYVTALAWLSVFGSIWYSWINELWKPYGIYVIWFSFVVALLVGLMTFGDKK